MYHGGNGFTGQGGRRRMDGGLVPVRLVGGFGMSDWTQTSPVRFRSRVQKAVWEKSSSQLGPGDWHGPHWAPARRPRTSQSARSPAHQAPDLP